MGTGEFNAGGNPVMDSHPIQERVEILLVTSSYSNRDKLRPDGPLGSYADFTSTSELLFDSFLERMLVQNISHENDLIFKRMKVQDMHFHTNSFAQRLVLPQRQKSTIHP